MKKTFLFFFLLTAGILFSQKTNTLKSYTFKEAYRLQEKEKKPLVLFFHTNWCKFCFAMKKNTFTNEKVIKLLNKNFYFISFDAESKDSLNIKGKVFKNKSGIHEIVEALATKNNTISYPSIILLNKNNVIDELIDSYLSAKEMSELLTTYLLKNTSENNLQNK